MIVLLARTLEEGEVPVVRTVAETVGAGVCETVGTGVGVGKGSGLPPATVTDTGVDANPLATTRTEDGPSVRSDGS